MHKAVNTVIIGGGCLGCAAAISTHRRLNKQGVDDEKVCIIEKSLVGSGLSAKHSGIVRAANAVPGAALLAKHATDYWKNLDSLWGVHCEFENNGAIWIARDTGSGSNKKWSALTAMLGDIGISFARIDRQEAGDICGKNVRLFDDEVYYHEPGAMQFDPSIVRKTLYNALRVNDIETHEKVQVEGFVRDGNGELKTVLTSAGDIDCINVVNAAGAWSPSIFQSLGLSIPVSTEAVNVVNWLTSQMDINRHMPIIADYTNLAYFRLWRDGEIHMHQPRRRNIRETARIFSEHPLSITGADFINEPSNQSLGYSQIRIYEDIARKRFDHMERAVYGSGYRSYFDITPDLKFILGRDNKVNNLFHCLGSGQAFKYTPVFGEIIADAITGEGEFLGNIQEFSIARFDDTYMEYFWSQVSGDDYTLETEATSL